MARLMMVGIRLNFPAWEKRHLRLSGQAMWWGGRSSVLGHLNPRQAGPLVYLSVHDDIDSDPIRFDECASGAAVYLVILGKPGTEWPRSTSEPGTE